MKQISCTIEEKQKMSLSSLIHWGIIGLSMLILVLAGLFDDLQAWEFFAVMWICFGEIVWLEFGNPIKLWLSNLNILFRYHQTVKMRFDIMLWFWIILGAPGLLIWSVVSGVTEFWGNWTHLFYILGAFVFAWAATKFSQGKAPGKLKDKPGKKRHRFKGLPMSWR